MTKEDTFATYIRIIGRGKKGASDLDFKQAHHAMQMILNQDISELQLGAFLLSLRIKEETAEELAGFVQAARQSINAPSISIDLDWSSYAGKRRHNAWFLLAAFALANQGYKILMHGSPAHTAERLYTEQAVQQLGLPICQNWQEAKQELQSSHFAYLPLQRFAPRLEQLLMLKPQLGLRTVVNTLCRLLNPLNAEYSIQSIFHPAYASKHCQAQQLLRQTNALIMKGDGGEFEYRPEASTKIHGLHQGQPFIHNWPKLHERSSKKPADETLNCQLLLDVWHEKVTHQYGQAAILGTLTVLLAWMKQLSPEQAASAAKNVWQQRQNDFLPERVSSPAASTLSNI